MKQTSGVGTFYVNSIPSLPQQSGHGSVPQDVSNARGNNRN